MIFRERGRERGVGVGRERASKQKRNIDVREKHPPVASCMPPTRDQACVLGMCPEEFEPTTFRCTG